MEGLDIFLEIVEVVEIIIIISLTLNASIVGVEDTLHVTVEVIPTIMEVETSKRIITIMEIIGIITAVIAETVKQ